MAATARSKTFRVKLPTTPGKVAPAPQAREGFQGKPIPIKKSVRGKPVSGSPLTTEELVGSVPKMFYTGV